MSPLKSYFSLVSCPSLRQNLATPLEGGRGGTECLGGRPTTMMRINCSGQCIVSNGQFFFDHSLTAVIKRYDGAEGNLKWYFTT